MKTDERGDELLEQEPADLASFTECTGLVPALPPSREAVKDQLELYDVLRPRMRRRGAKKH